MLAQPSSNRVYDAAHSFSHSLSLSPLVRNPRTRRSHRITVFASPDDAGNALLTAAKSGDQNALLAIFGSDSKELLVSGDPVQDKNAKEAFVAGYGVMHRWRNMTDGAQVLLVGADNFPFPIPLKKNADGKWFFDTAAGKEEVLNRRIGRNELAIIEVCGAVVQAEAEYFAHAHDGERAKQYATKFLSDPGKQNGLYWQSADGQPASPLGPMVADATAEGYSAKADGHPAFHGYYFHMLKGQTDKAPGGAKEYVVNGKMSRWICLRRLPCAVRQLGSDDLHGQPGWRAARKGFGKDHGSNCCCNERVRS